ncbi:MOP flippase family protein [Colwellia piezophila]|uniref:MOP flippase family protein n=1 Tax=Colwellia piezophila TaxID=211668 RepID=UPI00037B0E6B|nr:MOP flippase family protein [Colwellia piezophila]
MSLKQKALNGVKWTSFSSISIAILQLAQVSILARYLAPSDFGLMAIVTVVIGFSALFMDMGISSAIIHKQDISHKQLSSLYWLNIFAGTVLFFIVYFSASMISQYYNEIQIIPLIQLLALTFFISAIGNQYRILNQKKLLFNRLAKVEIIAALISFVVAVLCAINDYGVYSLVYATLVNVSISNLIFMLQGLREHKPSLIYKHSEIKSLISFGLFQMGERSINYFNSQFDVILIGKLLGTEALGIYSIAKTLVMKPAEIINPIITKVTFPIMSTVQNDTKQLKNIYLKTINYLCSVNFPIYIAMAILAEPLVIVLFGDKWSEAILIMQILSFYFMFRSIGNPVGSLQLAKGRADLGFYWNLGLFSFIPLVIYLGSFYGLVGVATSLLSLQVFLNFPNWYFMVKPLCGAGFKEYFNEIITPLSIAILASIPGFLVYYFVLIESVYISSMFFLFLALAIYLYLTSKLNKSLWFMVLSTLKR